MKAAHRQKILLHHSKNLEGLTSLSHPHSRAESSGLRHAGEPRSGNGATYSAHVIPASIPEEIIITMTVTTVHHAMMLIDLLGFWRHLLYKVASHSHACSFILAVLWVEFRVSHMLGKYRTTEPFFNFSFILRKCLKDGFKVSFLHSWPFTCFVA